VTSRILSEQFFRLPFLSSLCEVILAVPLFTYFTALIHELLRLILRQIHSVFSFFLHTNIAPHYILPFEILKDILGRVFLGSTELRWGSEFSLYIFRSNVILYVKPAFYFDSAPFSGPNSNYFVDRY
jgi:hypothetical protein